MLQKDDILKTLKKYGFYSLNRAPFLYQNKEELGVYFVWPNKHYGNLERVLLFSNEEELESEVFKYWWFMNNKNKLPLTVEFDNYTTMNPQVIYKYKNNILSVDIMKNFYENQEQFVDPEEEQIKRQLERTSNILISILKEKFKIQNDTFLQVTELSENLRKLKNTYYQKLNEYQKDKCEVQKEIEILIDNHDDSDVLIQQLLDELAALDTIEELRNFITTLFTYLVDLDCSEAHIQNIYLLNRYPFEIEDMKKKIAVLDDELKAKKKLFKSKKDAMEEILKIEASSECVKMVPLSTYIENEKEQILSRYNIKENIDESMLGDYLVSMENIAISLPPVIEAKGIVRECSKESILAELKLKYESLSKREKSACFIASSFLKDCLHILMEQGAIRELNVHETISKLILNKQIDLFNDAYQILDHYMNAKIRVKYFSILKINSFETFMTSLVEALRILNNIHITSHYSFSAYYNSSLQGIVPLHLKNIFSYGYRTFYIGTVMPDVPLYYSPIEIVKQIDIIENTELLERENDCIFLLKNTITEQKKDNKHVVVKYEKDKLVVKKDCTYVSNMREKNRCTYYEYLIYNKDGGNS